MTPYGIDQKSPENQKEARHNAQLAALARARATPRKVRAGLKNDFLADAEWMELARERGMQLPNATTAPTTGKIENWYHRLGLSGQQFVAWCGWTPAEWIARNPTWGLRPLVGLLLEDFPETQP